MHAWQIAEFTGPPGLRCIEVPDPVPRAGEVLVRIRAVSLNYRDLAATRRERPGNLPAPFTMCSDGAGEVVAVGEGVRRWKPGDRVMPTFFQDWPAGGMTREVMKTALGGPLPDGPEEAVQVIRKHAPPEIPRARIERLLTFQREKIAELIERAERRQEGAA